MADIALHPIIAERWSPRAFSDEPVSRPQLEALAEAARWSASCFNEQPWRFVIATKAEPERYQKILDLLVPKNQEWAKEAWVLGLSFGKKTFTHNGVPNRFGLHDAGAALTQIFLEATALGLHGHGMGGFDAARAHAEFAVPDDFEVGAAFAIGHPQGDGHPPADRQRKPVSEIIFSGAWGQSAF